ncbi:bifunctional tRNA (5-methylaminomethyl-2-thiouridine)(34)-methyltransferase MnmD/FAD-dependent 5-carboxymethylaminomethyl-2-thiouridine(34) oxidoreductase MnmC [Chitinimonas lacunae]|uniref:tRNA 5-methylaminomethyl-2-thiouridine biosynthesis bifunctional protein MnmC n=1 Tax=Chitinimonas lacunae TaxID=1963018 RepID=A0ABV8MMG2_9NEIS
MAYTPLTTARLDWQEQGIPYSAVFDDVYHSGDGGLAQAHHVFLAGNDLPARWAGRERFSIAETGFGLGLNFLTTWQAWRADPARPARLHFVSVEKYPFVAADMATLHARLLGPEFAALSAELCAAWPLPLAGFHRLLLDHGRVSLTLLLGDALTLLPQLVGQIDAFYLDGFAPAKNPDLWNEQLFRQFARLAAPAATLATYTVAGAVRRGLEAHGFAVEKRDGFGRKRQMLAGRFVGRGKASLPPTERRCIVLGAGMAGAAAAERLAARGWQVDLLERETGPARAASGNHAGVLRPVVSNDDNLQARLARAAFLHAQHRLDGWPQLRWGRCGALQLARDEAEAERFAAITRQGFPTDYLQSVDSQRASELAGLPLAVGGLWFAQAGWITPPSLVSALLDQAGAALRCCYGVTVARIEADAAGHWQLFDDKGHLLAQAPVLVLANAADAARLLPAGNLPLASDPRHVSLLEVGAGLQNPSPLATPRSVICRSAYLTPPVDGLSCIGSSRVGQAAPASNLALLDAMVPGWTPPLVGGRDCARPGTRDRLPVIGPVADSRLLRPKHAGSLHLAPRLPGLYTLNGFGARGLTWALLGAELLASQIEGEVLPLERELVAAVDPGRFAAKDLERRGG